MGLTAQQNYNNPVTSGRMGRITGSGTSGTFNDGVDLVGQAAQPASTTRIYRIPVWGALSVTVTIKPTTTGTAATARIYSTLNDDVTENTAKAATSLTVTNNTITEATRTLNGERFVVLEVVTVAASTIAFTVAESRTPPQ